MNNKKLWGNIFVGLLALVPIGVVVNPILSAIGLAGTMLFLIVGLFFLVNLDD